MAPLTISQKETRSNKYYFICLQSEHVGLHRIAKQKNRMLQWSTLTDNDTNTNEHSGVRIHANKMKDQSYFGRPEKWMTSLLSFLFVYTLLLVNKNAYSFLLLFTHRKRHAFWMFLADTTCLAGLLQSLDKQIALIILAHSVG